MGQGLSTTVTKGEGEIARTREGSIADEAESDPREPTAQAR